MPFEPLRHTAVPSFLPVAIVVAIVTAITGCDIEIDIDDDLEDSRVVDHLQDHLDELHAAGITGVLAEIAIDDQRASARSGADRAGGSQPVPWDARFRMGSVTKSLVAVVALQLVGEGRLSLDDTVDDWLPGVVAGDGYDARAITIRHLLQHTSGIANYTADLFATLTPDTYQERRLDHYDAIDLVDIAMQHPPEFAPGTGWSYSNSNYILAGLVIERITGRPWASEIHDRILEPLGMDDTTEPGDDPELPPLHALGYEQFGDGGPLIDVTLQNQTFAGAAGSMISTSHDLVRFWRALRRGQLLRPAQMAEMERTVLATPLQEVWPGVRYGLGIMEFPASCGGAFWSHFGDTLGFSTRLAASDDGDRVVVVSLSTNLAGASSAAIFAENQQLLDDAMCDRR